VCYGPHDIIFSSEHGAQQSDEVNIIEPTRNYGWPNVQGACDTQTEMNFCAANNIKEPLMEWTPCVAVNDLLYYDHPAIPEFKGSILMAVLGGFARLPRVSQLILSPDGRSIIEERQYLTNLGRIRDIEVNPHTGALYIVDNGSTYPGSGPNKVIEYRNLAYDPTNIENEEVPTFGIIGSTIVSENLMLKLSESLQKNVCSITDLQGRIWLSTELAPSYQNIDISNLKNGIYFINILTDHGSHSMKFIKMER